MRPLSSILGISLGPLRKLACTGLLLLPLATSTWAQDVKTLKPATEFPQHPLENQWYFNDVLHKAWIFRGGRWQPFDAENCRSVKFCNGHAIVKDGFRYMLARENGTVLVRSAPAIRFMDAFMVVGSDKRIEYLLDQAGDTVAALVDNCKIYSDTIQGELVYCFPQYQKGLERYNCFDLRNWGMMDGAGKWVIDPKFDKPFQFRNGQAAVVYKGQHLFINEKGAFVKE